MNDVLKLANECGVSESDLLNFAKMTISNLISGSTLPTEDEIMAAMVKGVEKNGSMTQQVLTLRRTRAEFVEAMRPGLYEFLRSDTHSPA